MICFNIGRRNFSGLNRYSENLQYQPAFKELLRRGVLLEDAHQALKAAMSRNHSEAVIWCRGKKAHIEISVVKEVSYG